RPLGGDVSVDGLGLSDADRAALAQADVVIHSAAAVSFDSPLDAAVAVNLLGPSRVAQALTTAGSSAHLVAVSTAYVAGNRRGEAPEALLTDTLFSTEVDWRAEVAGAERARADADAESRRPGGLRRFLEAARAEPVIISYARGLLKEFPGLPEGIVDVIPVDFVVAAALAIAAGAVPEEPVVYQAVTGARNPLKYRTLVDLVQDWFSARPLYDDA